MLLLPSLLLLGCHFAAMGLAADEPSTAAAFEAVYFYYGYLHEFAVHGGNTTIGSRRCRETQCTFDSFFVNVIQGSGDGGYTIGGVEFDPGADGKTALEMGKELQAAGLKNRVDWDYQKLVVGASKERGYLDMITYVFNRVRLDAKEKGSQDRVYGTVVNALHHIREAHAKDETDEFKKQLEKELPADKFVFKKLPEPDATDETVTRQIIDLVNMAKVWVLEVSLPDLFDKFKKAHTNTLKTRGFKDLQLGHALASLTITFQACYKGEPFPPHLLNWQ